MRIAFFIFIVAVVAFLSGCVVSSPDEIEGRSPDRTFATWQSPEDAIDLIAQASEAVFVRPEQVDLVRHRIVIYNRHIFNDSHVITLVVARADVAARGSTIRMWGAGASSVGVIERLWAEYSSRLAATGVGYSVRQDLPEQPVGDSTVEAAR